MRHVHLQRAELVPLFWGLADTFVLGRYLVGAIRRGSVPFLGDLTQAHETASQLDYDLMVWLSAAGALLMASLVASSVLLLCRTHAGAILSYAQAPFRVSMVLPSIPFLSWFYPLFEELDFDILGVPANIAVGLVLVALLELLRVVSLIWWRRRVRAA